MTARSSIFRNLRRQAIGQHGQWVFTVPIPQLGIRLRADAASGAAQDPLEILKALRGGTRPSQQPPRAPRPPAVHKGAKKHLACLSLDEHATAEEIRTQFKALVKLHHPDHNGGDRGSEERFREVIAAYNYLKQAGLC